MKYADADAASRYHHEKAGNSDLDKILVVDETIKANCCNTVVPSFLETLSLFIKAFTTESIGQIFAQLDSKSRSSISRYMAHRPVSKRTSKDDITMHSQFKK